MPKKILLIEDNYSISELYRHVLNKKDSLEIITAMDGKLGVEAARKHLPDLILLDIMMPHMTGIEALKRLKSNPATKHIPVVVLTNLGQESIIKQMKGLGAIDYLIKITIGPYGLADKVIEILDEIADKTKK